MSSKIHFFASVADRSSEFHDGGSHCLIAMTRQTARNLLRYHDEVAAMLVRLNGADAFKPDVEIAQCPVELTFLSPDSTKEAGEQLIAIAEDQSVMQPLPHKSRSYWEKAGEEDRVECRAVVVDVGHGFRFNALDKHSETSFSSQLLPLSQVRMIAGVEATT